MSALEPRRNHVVVGVDGSAGSQAALRWAHRQAGLWQADLEVVVAWPVTDGAGIRADDRERAEDLGTSVLAWTGIDRTGRRGSDVCLWVSVAAGSADAVLLRRAQAARLLVVGPHARHALGERLMGTVTERVLRHAAGPVAVVRAVESAPRHGIVVGTDGTTATEPALRWAVQQAQLTDSDVEAVLVWDWRPEYAVPPFGPTSDEQQARAETTLARAVAGLPEQGRERVRAKVVQGGDIAAALLAAAADADLLVIGTHRPGRIASRLPGAVAWVAATHGTVPVVVTPDALRGR